MSRADDFDDIIDRFKKMFNINTDLFDVDMFILPESRKDLVKDFDIDLDDKNIKGFKVSYHFEKGMDKPEIKVEGEIDNEKLNDYLKKINLPNKFLPVYIKPKGELDVNELSLELCKEEDDSCVTEPYLEINHFESFSEIIIEAPGVKKDDVNLTFSKDGRNVTFSAQNQDRKYYKTIKLKFKSSLNDYSLDFNNGIIILIIKKKN